MTTFLNDKYTTLKLLRIKNKMFKYQIYFSKCKCICIMNAYYNMSKFIIYIRNTKNIYSKF